MWEPPESELTDWRTLEVPEERDIQLVQLWDKIKYGPSRFNEPAYNSGTDGELKVGCSPANKGMETKRTYKTIFFKRRYSYIEVTWKGTCSS